MKKIFIFTASIFLVFAIFFLSLHIYEQSKIKKEEEVFNDLLADVSVDKITVSTFDEISDDTITATQIQTTDKSQDNNNYENNYYVPNAIDMNKLHSINPDISGWICLENSPINYPVLSSSGNEYLNKNIYGNSSISGSIFVYDNQNFYEKDGMDRNIVIYGHNMDNGTMFSYLSSIYNNPYFLQTQQNEYIYIYNKTNIYKYKIYSLYKIEKDGDYNQIHFKDEKTFLSFCEKTQKRDTNCKDFDFKGNENIITLTTCPDYDSQKFRIVLHAVLIEINKNIY